MYVQKADSRLILLALSAVLLVVKTAIEKGNALEVNDTDDDKEEKLCRQMLKLCSTQG